MKIRNGFVSNSSSSSFVILFPDDFDASKIDWSKVDLAALASDYFDGDFEDEDGNIVEGSEDELKKTIIEGVEKLQTEGELWSEDDYGVSEAISELFPDYIIAEFEGGPGDGKVVLADKAKVRKVLGI